MPGPQMEFEDTVVGVFERGNPWSSGYSTMDYVKSNFRDLGGGAC
jgi:hypothetical protein